MGIIGNRALQGQPILPYPQIKTYQGTDVFFDMAFLDHTGTPVVPTSISLEIDDLTNDVTMLNKTALVSSGSAALPLIYGAFASTMTMQTSGNLIWQMTFSYEGSQLCQVNITFTAIDSVTGAQFTASAVSAVIELCAIQTPSGL